MKIKTVFLLIIICTSCKKVDEVDKSKVLPFYNSEEFTPEWIAKTDVNYNNIHTVASFEFVNQNGKK